MYMHTTRINTKKELRQNSGKEATMARIIFHIDVNSAFLSWTAVEQLKNGSKVDLREIPAIIGGDQSSRDRIVHLISHVQINTVLPLFCRSVPCVHHDQ